MGIKDKGLTQGLLDALASEERALIEVEKQYREARIRFDVATRKYAAVRDMVAAQLGFSPYTINIAGWPIAGRNLKDELGRHRFINMKPGDAAITALQEVEEPLTLEEIIERLNTGGIRISGTLLTRMINAALMKTSGIQKTADGKYFHQEEGGEKAEELPF